DSLQGGQAGPARVRRRPEDLLRELHFAVLLRLEALLPRLHVAITGGPGGETDEREGAENQRRRQHRTGKRPPLQAGTHGDLLQGSGHMPNGMRAVGPRVFSIQAEFATTELARQTGEGG